MEKIRLKETDNAYIRDGNRGGLGCGIVNNDGYLYLIDESKREAYRLPEKNKDTRLILYHPCGGYQDGLIMVSTLGEIDLRYHHDFYDTAGMWGWIDLEGNEVIPPQYVFAMSLLMDVPLSVKATGLLMTKGATGARMNNGASSTEPEKRSYLAVLMRSILWRILIGICFAMKAVGKTDITAFMIWMPGTSL